MTADEYVRQVLRRYDIDTGPTSPVQVAADYLVPKLERWAGDYLTGKGVVVTGSLAKGTPVSCGTDLDLFISLRNDTRASLRGIFGSLLDFAHRNGWQPRPQNVSIGVTVDGVNVDLVPARVQPDVRNAHSIFVGRLNSWTKTDVFQHIGLVANSRRTEEIRAVKVWRHLNGLSFPSFYLELTVLEALYGCSTTALSENFVRVLRYLTNTFSTARVVDPANTNNVISDDLTAAEKARIAHAAALSLAANWNQVIW